MTTHHPPPITGQILGGALPFEAAKYQLMILFMITGVVLSTVCAGLFFAVTTLFDTSDRLLIRRLTKREGPKMDVLSR